MSLDIEDAYRGLSWGYIAPIIMCFLNEIQCFDFTKRLLNLI